MTPTLPSFRHPHASRGQRHTDTTPEAVQRRLREAYVRVARLAVEHEAEPVACRAGAPEALRVCVVAGRAGAGAYDADTGGGGVMINSYVCVRVSA